MAEFPEICPISRRFTAAQYPTRRFNSISGAGTTRLYGSKAFDARLDLEFLVNDDALTSVFDSWYESFGQFKQLILPPPVIAGSNELLDSITPDYLEWYWDREPSVETVQPGLSRVTVNLVGRLEIEP